MNTELNEAEWRTIHNALSVYQSQQANFLGEFHARGARRRTEIQQLMDKVRDVYIQPFRIGQSEI